MNLLSARLITEYGMSLEEAKRFWMMTICVMTSMTDLAGMSSLMSWSLHASENGAFEEALSEQTDLCRLTRKDLPLMLPEGQRVITLQA